MWLAQVEKKIPNEVSYELMANNNTPSSLDRLKDTYHNEWTIIKSMISLSYEHPWIVKTKCH
jgi:hypothetical protein